jgi:uncharacterized iron-regulated membrane protein
MSQGLVNLMPFMRVLHGGLARGTGTTVLGWIAVLWTLDHFVTLYLTLPRRHTQNPSGPGRVGSHDGRPPGRCRRQRYGFRLNFDLHRAGGLWTWLFLLVFAWSSVYLNLHWVYAPITGAVLDYPANNNHGGGLSRLAKPLETPALSWHQAQEHAAGELTKAGLSLTRVESLHYSPVVSVCTYRVATNMDIQTTGSRTYVTVDGNTGALTGLRLPSGQHRGLTFTNWIYALPMANVFGLPYRIVVFIVGLAMTALSVTGVYDALPEPPPFPPDTPATLRVVERDRGPSRSQTRR